MKNMEWISTKERLPEEGIYVLARRKGDNWIDITDPENVNCVVVKLVKGLSKKDRQLMKDGFLPSIDVDVDNSTCSKAKRYNIYSGEDEWGNNLVPYKWDTFGPSSFFGQDIMYWTPIPPFNNKKQL